MKSSVQRFVVGIILAGGLPVSSLQAAETETRALPTLLIKGEIVSVDTADPAAVLIKVKDRYGFETPIFLMSTTAITQGEAPVNVASLSTGTPVEVEYSFDVNTAKRHAVSVKLTVPASAAPAAAATMPAEPMPAVEPPAEMPTPDASSEAAPAASKEAQPVTP